MSQFLGNRDTCARNADVVVVGAGAAGLATAIFAARRLPGCRVVALDGAKKVGAKILVAGGGRCNVTNERVAATDFFGGSRNSIKQVLAAFPALDAVEFFREIGVEMHIEEHGKYFPNTNSARTVLHALLGEAQRLGITIAENRRVTDIQLTPTGFETATSQETIASTCVVLATGGRSLPKTGSDGAGYALAKSLGHSVIETTPGLVPLVLNGKFHVPLAGISLDVEMEICVAGEKPLRHRGALLWTHFGVSGPAVLDVSRHWHRAVLEKKGVQVFVNFLPGYALQQAEEKLIHLAQAQPRSILENALTTLLPSRMAGGILHELGIEPRTVMAHLGREARHRLAGALVRWPLPVRDSRGYNFAEVTAGGVPLSEIDPRTMESRVCPGMYLVGEILDVDGRIGGFNFQWAWSSGFVAAGGIARRISRDTTTAKDQEPKNLA